MQSFVTEPEVVLVGKPILEIEGVMKFLDDHGYIWPQLQEKINSCMSLGDDDGEWIIEASARQCYQSWGKNGEEFKGRSHEEHIKNLINTGHLSCIEHANFTFAIWNVSRTLTHELVRHRIASFSQLSQRYCDSSSVAFIVPSAIQELAKIDPDTYRTWVEHCERSRQFYEELTSKLSDMYSDIENKLERRKKARQAARSVLPGCTETKLNMTMNARELRHFITLRASALADNEIRALAVKIFKIMDNNFPLLMHNLELVRLPDGTEGVKKI
jgi:thymidylate synthase (FAD)